LKSNTTVDEKVYSKLLQANINALKEGVEISNSYRIPMLYIHHITTLSLASYRTEPSSFRQDHRAKISPIAKASCQSPDAGAYFAPCSRNPFPRHR